MDIQILLCILVARWEHWLPSDLNSKLDIVKSWICPVSYFLFLCGLQIIKFSDSANFFFTHLLEKLNVFVTKHLKLFPLNRVFETFLDL